MYMLLQHDSFSSILWESDSSQFVIASCILYHLYQGAMTILLEMNIGLLACKKRQVQLKDLTN